MKLNAFKRLSILASVLSNTNMVKVDHDMVQYNHQLTVLCTDSRAEFLVNKYDLRIIGTQEGKRDETFFTFVSNKNWADDATMKIIEGFINF